MLPAQAERAGRAAPLIDGRPSAIDGLSWYCAPGGRRCHYTGSHNGYHALVYWDRDRLESVAFVSNSTIPAWTIIPLQRGLVDLLAGRAATPQTPATAALAQLPRSALGTAAGRYHAPGLGLVHLNWNGQRLQVRTEGGLPLDAYPVSRSVLYVPGSDWLVGSSPGAGGDPRPAQLHVRRMYVHADATRLPD